METNCKFLMIATQKYVKEEERKKQVFKNINFKRHRENVE